MYAITPRGVGKEVGARAVRPEWQLADGETFTVDNWLPGMVIGDDGISVRDKNAAEIDADEVEVLKDIAIKAEQRKVGESAIDNGSTPEAIAYRSRR